MPLRDLDTIKLARALHDAICVGSMDLVSDLLSVAGPTYTDLIENGWYPHEMAAAYGRCQILERLIIAYGSQIDFTNSNYYVMYLALQEDYELSTDSEEPETLLEFLLCRLPYVAEELPDYAPEVLSKLSTCSSENRKATLERLIPVYRELRCLPLSDRQQLRTSRHLPTHVKI